MEVSGITGASGPRGALDVPSLATRLIDRTLGNLAQGAGGQGGGGASVAQAGPAGVGGRGTRIDVMA